MFNIYLLRLLWHLACVMFNIYLLRLLWHLACVMFDIYLLRLLWLDCPGRAGVKGNDRAGRSNHHKRFLEDLE